VWWFTSVIPDIKEAEIGGLWFKSTLGKKTLITKKKLAPVIPAMQEVEVGELQCELLRSYFKNY
jgi:hypothetical protein